MAAGRGLNEGRRRLFASLFDATLAAALTYTSFSLTSEMAAVLSLSPTAELAARVVAVAHAAPLLVRRAAPLGVLACCLATAAAYAWVGFPPPFLGPATLVATYTVAARRGRRVSLAALAVVQVMLLAALMLQGSLNDPDSALLYALLVGGAWLVGDNVGQRQAAAQAIADRAAQLERAREDLARYAVTQERLRIARELHDIVAHSMSVIAVQAGSGRLAAREDPAAAERALTVIERTTRGALAEMRQLLSVLRQHDDSRESLSPTPGLDDLHELVAQVVAAGVNVDVRVEGQPRELPPGVDLSAYRIVQEALTNVVKHAGPTQAAVVVHYGDREIGVEVVDSGPSDGGPAQGERDGGQGMVGMRERVAMYGGQLDAGPLPGRGYRVAVTLPYPGSQR